MARFVPGGISLFDDGGLGAPPDGGPYGPGRGLILNLDLQDHTASLASPPLYHDPALYPNSQGDLQVLGNGDVLVGWGSDTQAGGELSSYYTEYSSSGSVLADYVLAGQDVSYRAYSLPWVGLPLKKPAAAAVRCERASDRVRLLERLDTDGRLGVARRPHADVAVAGLDHIAHGLRDGDRNHSRRTLLRGQGDRRRRRGIEYLRRHPRPQLERFTLELHTGRVVMRMQPWPLLRSEGGVFRDWSRGVAGTGRPPKYRSSLNGNRTRPDRLVTS